MDAAGGEGMMDAVAEGAAQAAAAGMLSGHAELAEQVLGQIPEPLRVYLGGTGFFTALMQSFLMILVTEIGDRTFFIAAIMAMKNGRMHVLIGALAALYVMTVLSAALGKAFPLLFDQKYTSIAAGLLFVYFGVLMLREWYQKRNEVPTESEELQEVETELSTDVEKGEDKYHGQARLRFLVAVLSPVVIKAFTMTFLAEWGDRSQIATIALAAAKNVYGVTLGGLIGHTVCTTIAVVGGRLLASQISERAVLLTGGILFILFAGISASGRLA